MKRSDFALLCLLSLGGCGGPPAPSSFAFPAAVDAWKLKRTNDLPGAGVPEQIRRLGFARAQVGEYEGPGRLEAEVYRMTSSAAALEMEQTWKPAAETVVFHRATYFAVIRWQNAERAAVLAFVRRMEARLGESAGGTLE